MLQFTFMKFSIIIPTLNNEQEVKPFFDHLTQQTYSKDRIEIIAADGGSTDKTVSLLKKYGVTVIKNPFVLAEPGVHLGMQKASGELHTVLALDNFLGENDALEKIARVFENPEVFAAVLKHDNKPSYSLFTKYHNVFTDPFNHFINGYASNTRTFQKQYKTLRKGRDYDIYDFQSNETIPMMSFSQGFTVRGSFRRMKQDIYDDLAPVIDIIKQGKRIAYIHSVSVYHATTKDYKQFIRKQRWATENALSGKNFGLRHRFSELSLLQKIKTYIWPIYSLSIVLPTLRGIYGSFVDREPLWMFHPVECFLCGYANAVQVVDHFWGAVVGKKNITRK